MRTSVCIGLTAKSLDEHTYRLCNMTVDLVDKRGRPRSPGQIDVNICFNMVIMCNSNCWRENMLLFWLQDATEKDKQQT